LRETVYPVRSLLMSRGIPASAAKKEMGMIKQECPGIAGRPGFGKEGRESFQEILAVLIPFENRSALNTAYHDGMEYPRGIQAR
jgi:hypothetical protein